MRRLGFQKNSKLKINKTPLQSAIAAADFYSVSDIAVSTGVEI